MADERADLSESAVNEERPYTKEIMEPGMVRAIVKSEGPPQKRMVLPHPPTTPDAVRWGAFRPIMRA